MRHNVVSKGNTSPLLTRGNIMLTVHFHKVFNHLLEENMVIARLVNQQVLDFNSFCEFLADGSTVTSADCAAVLKQIEMRLPFVLAFNSKVICSPEGLTFRPAISGSITQSQLKKKLEARLLEDPTLEIDANRELQTSDLTVSDLTASIAIDLPQKWQERFQAKAEFKREKNTSDSETSEDESASNGGSASGSGSNSGSGSTTPSGGSGSNTGGSTPSGGGGTNTGGGENTGGSGGDDNGGDENGDAN